MKKKILVIGIVCFILLVAVLSTFPLSPKKEIAGYWLCDLNNYGNRESGLCDGIALEFYADGVYVIHQNGDLTTGRYEFISTNAIELSSESRSFYNGIIDLSFDSNNQMSMSKRDQYHWGVGWVRADPKFNFTDFLSQ